MFFECKLRLARRKCVSAPPRLEHGLRFFKCKLRLARRRRFSSASIGEAKVRVSPQRLEHGLRFFKCKLRLARRRKCVSAPKAGARSLILQVQRYKLFLIIPKKQRIFQQKIQIAMWRLQFFFQKKSFEKTRHSSPVAL